MTKEEAIKIIKSECYVFNPFNFDCTRMINTALDMAIEALEQEPCDDCISRKDTIKWLKKVTVTDGITFKTGFKQILHDIEQMPPVTPKQKMGRWWERNTYPQESRSWDCSECQEIVFERTDYCPNCGSRMEVEE